MSDLIIWGGPVNCSTIKRVTWLRPTVTICKPANGSTGNAALYHGIDDLVDQAGGDVQSIGLAGFSAFHGFANAALKDATSRERINYVHLADACFLGAGATTPHAGFAWFAERAAAGIVRMVATTNGPWGQDIHYTSNGTDYNLTSGAKCVELFWDTAVGTSGWVVPAWPSDVQAPTEARQIGELYWFHYEHAPSGKDPHAWHANDLAAPYIQMYGAPWLAGRAGQSGGGSRGGFGSLGLLAFLAAGVAGGAYLAKRRRKG